MDEIIYRGNVRVGSKRIKVLQRTKALVLLRRNGVLILEKSSGSKGKVVAELTNVECVTKCNEDPCKVTLHFRGSATGVSGRGSSQLELLVASPEECNMWHRTLVEVCNCPGVALPTAPRPQLLNVGGTSFLVHMLPASTVDIYGPCLLEVTDTAVILLDISDSSKQLLAWPLASLRRYGYNLDKFHFESGRSCETGEGHFAFTSKESATICARIHEQSVRLAESRSPGSQPTPSAIIGFHRQQSVEPPHGHVAQYMNEPEYLPVIGSDGGHSQDVHAATPALLPRRPLPPRPMH